MKLKTAIEILEDFYIHFMPSISRPDRDQDSPKSELAVPNIYQAIQVGLTDPMKPKELAQQRSFKAPKPSRILLS